jgi:hypothetical protein
MGFSISWLAFQGKSKDDVLSLMSMVDTGKLDDVNESPVSAALLPTAGIWCSAIISVLSHRNHWQDYLATAPFSLARSMRAQW